ncbi:hypothetical protein QCA50_003730 [Cerrena zonata]|uniref:ABC transporter domain-containing protein n=1 Tax=Cerrena zonata TaxID=2478898 RepID=A0AAW0GH63_9APHY
MSNEEKTSRPIPNEPKPLHPSLQDLYLGVWRVVWEPARTTIRSRLRITALQDLSHIDPLIPFFKDVYKTLGPWLLLTYFVADLWSGFGSTALLVFSNKVLTAIETSISTGHADGKGVLVPLGTYVAINVFFSCITWASERLGPIMEHRVRLHFDQRLVEAHCRFDYETSQGNILKREIYTGQLWRTFCGFLYVFKYISTAISQFIFLLSLARSQNEMPILVILCLAKPIISSLTEHSIWDRPSVIYIHDQDYLRLKALQRLVTGKEYKEEVITGGLSWYLIQEFKKTLTSLKHLVADSPDYSVKSNPVYSIVKDLSSDFPLMFYAVRAVYMPQVTSLASLAMLQQTSSALKSTFDHLYHAYGGWARRVNRIKSLYEVLELKNEMPEGDLDYPPLSEKHEKTCGMGIEFRNVSFGYPADDENNTQQAVQDVSFTIPPSSLVVIVGTNGSGKTTILKLLSSLYRPSSGSILIDGTPIETYKATSLHESTAVLTQNHQLFPFSVAENIGMGDPSHATDRERILRATKLGGSEGVIKKFKDGMDHFLEYNNTLFSTQPLVSGNLSDFFNSLERDTSVSGGEHQRLVASRTFMRIASNKIKLVMVDEPTSAMDPEGELHLFDGLRKMREGKTMIFVTHRFGHLTKHADLILCMKDGRLVESGTHQSLIDRQGEYSKLYNIQAQAFTTTVSETTS